MSKLIEILSKKYWYKCFENMQHTTAIIAESEDKKGYVIYFFGGACCTTTQESFDEIYYESFEEAQKDLGYNGFRSGKEDKDGCFKLTPPVYKGTKEDHRIYSSGKYWKR